MKYLKLFESFNDGVQYIVKKVGKSYRIFALTPKMKSEGGEYEDAESLFGKATMWTDYYTSDAAQKSIDSLSSNQYELEDDLEDRETDY
jgi:hypothetical protein